MTTQLNRRHRRSFGLAVAALLGAVGATACGAGAGGVKTTTTPANARAPLTLGQPSPEEQEISRYDKTGRFLITPKKVVEGTSEDLRELGDDAKYKNQKIVWVYVNVHHVGGETVKGPMVMTDIGAETAAGGKATRLILMGYLNSRPRDCFGEDTEAPSKQGDSRTVCAPYLIPGSATVKKVTYFQGYYNKPLAWKVP